LISNKKWGDESNYDLYIDVSSNINEIVEIIVKEANKLIS